ncbi:hypothetical protein [uncultured Gimesia sp.]|uniref:hypothetical protein n=1 Tax=uncultured Gimesia sp. TaxID=1678688 RepID=UPI0030DB785A|tara:strand:+ start:68344 stop:68988 length:645 start_codon:yes stop_codon:yes gene_type:complete
MTIVIRILFVLGLAGTIFGARETLLVFRGTAEPEQVTLAALGQKDGTDNVHLTITDFEFGEGVVFEEKKNGEWKQIWIPLVLEGEKWTDRPVIARTNEISREADLISLILKPELTGVVSNFLGGLGSDQKKQFKAMYPNAALDGAIVFDLNKKFPSPIYAISILVVGVVCLIGAIGLFFGLFQRKETAPVHADHSAAGSAWAEPPEDPADRQES